MPNTAFDVNSIEQDNEPRSAYYASARVQFNKIGIWHPSRIVSDQSVETIIVAYARKRIGKLRDLKTGKSEASANVSMYDFKRLVLARGRELYDLAKMLEALDPQHEALIPGDLISPSAGIYAPRLIIPRPGELWGEPTIHDRASRLVKLDLDKLAVPNDFDYHSKRHLADVVKAALPPFAQNALMLICATTSHGYNPGRTGARAFFMLDRPLTLKQQKVLFAPWCNTKKNPDAKIDPRLFVANQLTFVGAAFHLDGMPALDPYAGVRFFFDNRDGGEVVVTDDMLDATFETVVDIETKPDGTSRPVTVRRVREIDLEDDVPHFKSFAEALETIAATDDLTGASAHYQTIGAARAAFYDNPYADTKAAESAIRNALQTRFDKAAAAGNPRGAGDIADRLDDVSRQVRDAETLVGKPNRKLGSKPAPAPTMTADEAQSALKPHIDRIIDAAVVRSRWHATPVKDRTKEAAPTAPVLVSRVTPGVGKSRATIERIAEEVMKARAEGRIFRALYAVPNHALGREKADDFRALGVRVGRYISPHYNGAEFGDPTCHHPHLVATFQAPYGTISNFCNECPLLKRCAIGLQDHSEAEVVILAGPALSNQLPPAIRRKGYQRNPFASTTPEVDDDGTVIEVDDGYSIFDKHFDLIVVDEAPLASWTKEFEATAGELTWTGDTFDVASVITGTDDAAQIRADQLLQRIAAFERATKPARAVVSAMMDALTEEGFAPDDSELTKFGPGYWHRVHVAAYDILERPDAEIARAILNSQGDDPGERYRPMVELAKAARAWLRMAECMSPNPTDGSRGVVRFGAVDSFGNVAVKMEWRGEIHPDHVGTPLLVLDATASEFLIARFVPGASFVDIAAKDGPQVVRRLWEADATDGALDHVPRLERLLKGIADLPGRRKGLVTTKKAIATATNFRSELLKPFWIAQYADLRGSNVLEKVDHLALLGRQFAPFEAVRDTAVRIFGRDLADREGFNADPTKVKAPIAMRDGSTVFLDVYWHPLSEIRAVLAMIRDDEIVQGDGRARACRRLDALTIDHFTHGATLGVIYDEIGLNLAHKGSISEAILDLAKTGFAASHRKAWAAAAGLTDKQVKEWSIRETIMGKSGREFLNDIWTNAVAAETPMELASFGRLKIAATDLSALLPKKVFALEPRMVESVEITL